MNKFYLTLVFLFCITSGFSQSENESQNLTLDSEKSDTKEDNNFFLEYYFGVGMNYTDALNINPHLSEIGVPTVRRFPFEISFGLGFYFKEKNKIEIDLGVANMSREDGNFGHEIRNVSAGVRYTRNILETKGINFLNVGLGLSSFNGSLEFFNKSSNIDLDDPNSFGEIAKINHQQFMIGPTIGYVFRDKDKPKKEQLRIQLSYDINISENDWESEYANVSNSMNENMNRFRLQLIFPFLHL
ncbi:hypothetical protein [Psychroflexus aestuariivivens]|uniref:hypothetical protein n=1 Tax=Psychroflexus aestuariivivens TaxID=1795040 RepID=UPI000FD7F3D3|nr:hypothetical protein [Psychroflexus aestuariivivens]